MKRGRNRKSDFWALYERVENVFVNYMGSLPKRDYYEAKKRRI